ncbi:hypothetical protein [Labrys wisconsinensis]|uniref:Uncharacterized protein n=1 Tax=Labrys wisconsinensis TaxID=425677 RepID=A0ABU0J2L7_9HYPH|nr:hypothetical protein [Labrys wisconsinensis]MDQ0468506.1 hypothetical protein [Labrys wisconsinensis]
MSLEIQNFTVYLNNPNYTATFNAAVKQYVAGITGFNMSYKDGKGHDVQTFLLSLQVNQTSSDQLDFKVTGQLSDNGGNTVDSGAAWVSIGVIAETGTESGNITLANADDIASGGSSGGVPLAQSSPSINVGLLSGFDLSYGTGTDHDVQMVNASASVTQSSGMDYIKAEALMKDGGKNSATTASIDGGLLATFKANAGVVATSVTDQQSTSAVSVDLGTLIPANYKLSGDVMAVLTGYQISYGGNTGNDVNTIGAGLTASGGSDGNWAAPGLPSITAGTTSVNLPNPQAYMYDLGWPSNHGQDDSESGVNLIVIATIVPV